MKEKLFKVMMVAIICLQLIGLGFQAITWHELKEIWTDTVVQEVEKSKTNGEKIATYTKSFYEEYATECVYDLNCERRAKAYNLEKVEGKFHMDCVGFTNLVVHQATGLELEDDGAYSFFVAPIMCGSDESPRASNGASIVSWSYEEEQLKPGDVLCVKNMQHIVIYVGNGEIIQITNEGLRCSPLDTYDYSAIARVE